MADVLASSRVKFVLGRIGKDAAENCQDIKLNPLLPRPKGDKDAEGMKKQIPSSNTKEPTNI